MERYSIRLLPRWLKPLIYVAGLSAFVLPWYGVDVFLVLYLVPALSLVITPTCLLLLKPFEGATVDVGDYGALVRRRARFARFHPYAEIDSVRLIGRAKRDLRVDVGGRRAFVVERPWSPQRIVQTFEDGMRAARALPDHAAAIASMSRRELGQASLGHGANYRVAAPTREELWALVEARAARVSARLAAAEAIVATLKDEERLRFVEVVEACPDHATRRAFEALARRASAEKELP